MAATTAARIGVIICSVRTPRVGLSVSHWIKDVIDARENDTDTEYSLVDLVEFKLPLFDENIIPAMVPAKGNYSKEHTKAWSKEISKYGAYVFVTPEYNYGIPGATKNAVDFLYNEWLNKPAMVISYGVQGGKDSSAALCQTLEGMKLQVCAARPNLPFHGGQGPDTFAAMGGSLGDDTKADWEKEQRPLILEGIAELEEKLAASLVPRKEEAQ